MVKESPIEDIFGQDLPILEKIKDGIDVLKEV